VEEEGEVVVAVAEEEVVVVVGEEEWGEWGWTLKARVRWEVGQSCVSLMVL
jgi:hypothetical protein